MLGGNSRKKRQVLPSGFPDHLGNLYRLRLQKAGQDKDLLDFGSFPEDLVLEDVPLRKIVQTKSGDFKVEEEEEFHCLNFRGDVVFSVKQEVQCSLFNRKTKKREYKLWQRGETVGQVLRRHSGIPELYGVLYEKRVQGRLKILIVYICLHGYCLGKLL